MLKSLKDKVKRSRSNEYIRTIKCLTHPERHAKLRPPDNCSSCWLNYEKVKLKSRQTMQENGTGKFGDPHGGRGKCGVCQRKESRMTNNHLPSGLKICEGCLERFDQADGLASSVEYIRRDMADYNQGIEGQNLWSTGTYHSDKEV